MKTLKLFFFLPFILISIYSCKEDNITSNPTIPTSGINTVDYFPVWSNSGSKIVYYHFTNNFDSIGIYVIDTNGLNNIMIINDQTCLPTDFSPDGNWLLLNNSQIYKININSDSIIQLTNEGFSWNAVWSPDGNWIAYISNVGAFGNSSALWIMNPDGTMKQKAGNTEYASWYNNNINILTFDKEQNIRKISILDSTEKILMMNLKQLNPEYPYNYDIKLSPDNSKIYFYAGHSLAINYQIFSVNIDGSNLKKLTNTQGRSFSISPDGQQIVYCDSSPSSGYLWIMNIDGTNKRQLTFP